MMEFGSNNAFSSYPFSPTAIAPQFQDMSMGNSMGNYGQSDMLPMGDMSPNMMGNMMSDNFADMGIGQLGSDPSGMNLFQPQVDNSFSPTLNTAQADFSMAMNTDDNTPSNATSLGLDDRDDHMMTMTGSFSTVTAPANRGPSQQQQQPSQKPQPQQQQQNQTSQQNLTVNNRPSLSKSRETSSQSINTAQSTPRTSVTEPSASPIPIGPPTPGGDNQPKTVYSKSGFDMLRALWYVATRKNPTIHLGAVDMSCAFVVCDVTLNDCPIIYVSDNFQNLTGYNRHEIVGQNCRFLQAPSGKVEAGVKREFVDDAAVFNLKKNIAEGQEVQQSLINYRKGGKPFLNLLTMIPIPWDTDEIRYFVGFQIDLVECPDAIGAGQDNGGVKVNYKHSDIGQYIWNPPTSSQWEPESGQTLGMDDVSTLLQQYDPKGSPSDWHRQSWDKMLLENTDDVVHVLSLKGVFQYVSPSCKRVLEYDAADLVGSALSTVCHPSDIVPVTRELKDTAAGAPVNIVFRIRRKKSGYTWFESHGSLFSEQGKGRKCIILVGRKRPVFALSRRDLEANGGIGDSELWTKLSTSGMFLFVSSSIKCLLDLQPDALVGTSIQELMRKESRAEFGRAIEKARRGKVVSCKHEVTNRRDQVLQAQTILYPGDGDARDGQKPTFLLAQTKLLKASSRAMAPATASQSGASAKSSGASTCKGVTSPILPGQQQPAGFATAPGGEGLAPGSQDFALASDDNIFGELRTTKCSSWQFELRQMEKVNRILAEELGGLLTNKKKRKRRKGVGNIARDCANCHTRNTPEWRRGPSGQRDLCNSCGLRWAKQVRTGRCLGPRPRLLPAQRCRTCVFANEGRFPRPVVFLRGPRHAAAGTATATRRVSAPTPRSTRRRSTRRLRMTATARPAAPTVVTTAVARRVPASRRCKA